MRRPARPAAVLAAATVLSLAACSGGSAPGAPASPAAPSSSTSTPAESAAPSATGSASPSLAELPAARCLTGDWSLIRFVAVSGQTYGTGEGGDLTVRFGTGTYTLTGAGRKPMTLTLAGNSGTLLVDGTSEGTYTLKDSTATFTAGSAKGSGTVELGGRKQRLTMDQVANVVGLAGDGQVACTDKAMTITLSAVRLELGRV